MGVKELRAELAARHAAVAGNKKELAKRLQKLRQDAARGATPFAQQKLARKVCPTFLARLHPCSVDSFESND